MISANYIRILMSFPAISSNYYQQKHTFKIALIKTSLIIQLYCLHWQQ